VVACAASSTASSSPPFPPPLAQQTFEPIRYGDDAAHAYEAPFFQIEGRAPRYDAAIPTPDSLLGRPVREPSHAPRRDRRGFRRWAELSPRIRVRNVRSDLRRSRARVRAHQLGRESGADRDDQARSTASGIRVGRASTKASGSAPRLRRSRGSGTRSTGTRLPARTPRSPSHTT
jgi:hypothetical protein